MTAEEPLDTSSREKSVRMKDLMTKTRIGAPAPSRLRRDDVAAAAAESRPGCMWSARAEEWPGNTGGVEGLGHLYIKPTPPSAAKKKRKKEKKKVIVTHSQQRRLINTPR